MAELPPEARATLALIRKGGPYPYAKDDAVFGNREARLPRQKRGYYREYTVKTPGERTRGARRIVAGKGGEMLLHRRPLQHLPARPGAGAQMTLAALEDPARGANAAACSSCPATPPAKAVQQALKGAGFAFFHVDGKNIARKEQLLNALATALRLPKHFGHNWDALEECLVDLDCPRPTASCLYYDHIDGLLEAHPDQFETLVEICRDAVASWKEDGTPIVVLFSGTKAPKGVSKLKEKASED